MRPCELRNNLLNRWVRMKREETYLKSWERPDDPGTVQSLSECLRWKQKLGYELMERIDKLYSEPMPDAMTRSLNDEVNSHIRLIRKWEARILELGGIDYSHVGIKIPDGEILLSNLNQYLYLGRARNLPEVKDLLEQEKQKKEDLDNAKSRKNKEELMKRVNAWYYGLGDDTELTNQEKPFNNPNHIDPILKPKYLPTNQEIENALSKLYTGSVSKVTLGPV